MRAICALASGLGLEVIAEGVESQRSVLLGNSCHRFQGYLFGKPMPAMELEEMVSATAHGVATAAHDGQGVARGGYHRRRLQRLRRSAAELDQRLHPILVGIQARHQHQLTATRLDELLASAITDLLQRLDTVGDERRSTSPAASSRPARPARRARLGVGSIHLARPVATGTTPTTDPAQPGTRSEALGSADALGAVASGEHGPSARWRQSSPFRQCAPVGSDLCRCRSGSPWKLSSR